MGAREEILAALPDARPGEVPGWAPAAAARGEAPGWAPAAAAPGDRVEQFRLALEAAGGSLVVSSSPPEGPHLVGGPAVAESGAVWWVPANETERREAFLAETMRLRVPRSALVTDLHEAYRRIGERPHYGCFVSGPSKTADIEQALVIGAHGPRALEVWLDPEA